MERYRGFSTDDAPVFIAIGIDLENDGFLKLSGAWSRSWSGAIWDVELSIEERIQFLQMAAEQGWRLDAGLY